ncbi:MAG: hypothetical protein ABR562_04895 [Thermoplasmatota archaeon]
MDAFLGPFGVAFYFLPPIVLAIAYLALLRRMETRTQRFRVATIAVAILVFQVVATIQFNPNTPADTPLSALLPLVNLVAGLVAFWAYSPPAWLTRRFGIEPLADEEPRSDDLAAAVGRSG